MGCNFKVASIVVATLAITFSSLSLVKLSMSGVKHHHDHHGKHHEQKIDNGGMRLPHNRDDIREPWAAKPSTTEQPEVEDDDDDDYRGHRRGFGKKQHHHDRWEEVSKKLHQRDTTAQRIVGIIVCIISIITSFMIFGAVSDNQEHNQYKRHLILPFVVFHSLITFLHAVAIIYVSITFRQYMDVLVVPVLIYVALVLVTVIGISFVAKYYKSLARGVGFAYAQMEDVKKPVDEVKVPLA